MQNIVVNYKITRDIKDSHLLDKIIKSCQSSKYKIFLNIYDFSLEKKLQTQPTSEYDNSQIIVSYYEKHYEELSNADYIILQNLIQHGDSLAYLILPENFILNEMIFDSLDMSSLKEDTNGLIYFDYHINDVRCFLRSRAVNTQVNIPVIIWSTSKLIRHINEKEKMQIVGNNYASLHIPKSLCTIHTYEE